MTIGCFITITDPYKRGDLYDQCLESAKGFCDHFVIVGPEQGYSTRWPKEFSWDTIGWHFQYGYEQSKADWVIHLDTDFIFHENDYQAIRQACIDAKAAPALSFWKYQFILPDRYNLKSRLILAVNKGKYGDRIRFDSGGDLCQPSLDGDYLKPDDVPEARIPFYNYDFLNKSKAQVQDDIGRMDRAYQRHFGKWLYSEDGTNKSAYDGWLKMMLGRLAKPHEMLPLYNHPRVIQETIKALTPDKCGYSVFGNVEPASYYKGGISV